MEVGTLRKVALPSCVALASDGGQAGLAVVAGRHGAVACADGLLVILSEGSEDIVARKIPWPSPTSSARQILSHIKTARFVVDLTESTFAVFDMVNPTSAAKVIAKGAPDCAMALDPATGEQIVSLMTDGYVAVCALTGRGCKRSSEAAARATPCNNVALAVAPHRAYVLELSASLFVDVDLRNMSVAARHAIVGRPKGMAVLGLDEANVNVAEGFH